MIVCKFGGTSVADAAAIARLVEIVRGRSAERPVVVVSALAGVTDALLALAEPVHAGDGVGLDEAVDALLQRHETTARELRGGESALEPIRAETASLRSALRSALGRRLRPAEADRLA
ncbi:MAG TPA: hypothetical protein VJQ44_00840, partial [Gemmatimonadales bacterium]|nr:hypothetical protein [Gemmatimonadales bacterium]